MEKFLAVLGLLCACIVCISQVDCYSTDLYDDLYEKELTYEKTYDLIKELEADYKKRDDIRTILRRNRLENLLWLRDFNPEKCTEESWNTYLRQLRRFEDYKVNLLNYVLKAREELANYCKNSTKNLYTIDMKVIRDLEAKIFYEKSRLTPDDALSSMKQLKNLLQNFTHIAYVQKREEVEKLIDLSRLDNRKCSMESWDQLNKIQDHYDGNTFSVLDYVTYWKEQRRAYCMSTEEERSKVEKVMDPEQLLSVLHENATEPERTEKILKRLVELTKNTNDLHPDLHQNFVKLAALADLTKESCSLDSWTDYLTVLDGNRNDRLNIVPYMLYAKNKTASYCKEKFPNQINYFKDDPFGWQESYGLVFDEKAPQLEPSKVHELLGKLHNSFRYREDMASIMRRVPVTQLYHLDRTELGDKCTLESWEALYSLYETYKAHHNENIVRYLNQNRENLAKSCKSKGSWYNVDIAKLLEMESTLSAGHEMANQKVHPMTPEETLNLIKSLRSMYQSIGDSVTTLPKSKHLNDLIEMTKVTPEKCNTKVFHRNREMMFENSQSTLNLLPFINYWKDKQMKLCANIPV